MSGLAVVMDDAGIVLPETFKHPRYFYGALLNFRTHWSDEDKTLFAAAADLGINRTDLENAFARPFSTLIDKAYEIGLHIPLAWRKVRRARPAPITRVRDPRQILSYPYIIKPSDDHADLLAVCRLVSKDMAGREDVIQDIMLALWESRTTLEELKSDTAALRKFNSAFRKASFERGGYGVESLDVPMANDMLKHESGDYQRMLIKHDDSFLEEYILNGKHHRITRNFADQIINELSDEEDRLGIPAALWVNAG